MFKYLALPADQNKSLSALQKLAYAILASFVITLSAKISIPMYPVPTTMQPFVVILLGCIMGPRLAVASVVVYLTQALFGLPVLQGPLSGPAALMGPTGGYLFGFLIAAYVCGVLYHNGFGRTFVSGLGLFTIGAICFDIPGVAWLTFIANFDVAKAAYLSYQPAFVLKTGLGAAILAAIAHHRHHHKPNSKT